jgi:DNA-binding CsgD family transcriptional regulator
VRLERALLLARFDPRRVRDVRADVEAALADSTAAGCRRCRLEVRARGAEALGRIGDPAAAGALLEAWDADPRNRALRLWAVQARAAVITAHGDLPSAAREWRDAVGEADRCGFVLEGLWGRAQLGQVLSALDRPAAADLLREAGALAERCGARAELKSVEQGLRALGVRTWRRAAGDPSSDLTPREREVAARVAAGESNAEIAAAMFLSRKTVERHVSNVLARAGLRNRAELAALWSGGGRQPEGVHR